MTTTPATHELNQLLQDLRAQTAQLSRELEQHQANIAALETTLQLLNSQHTQRPTHKPQHTSTPAESKSHISDILAAMQARPGQELHLTEIAKAAGANPDHPGTTRAALLALAKRHPELRQIGPRRGWQWNPTTAAPAPPPTPKPQPPTFTTHIPDGSLEARAEKLYKLWHIDTLGQPFTDFTAWLRKVGHDPAPAYADWHQTFRPNGTTISHAFGNPKTTP